MLCLIRLLNSAFHCSAKYAHIFASENSDQREQAIIPAGSGHIPYVGMITYNEAEDDAEI